MSESKTSRWITGWLLRLYHPLIPMMVGIFFLVVGLALVVMHIVDYPYPQWKESRAYELDNPNRVFIDERLGWWASSESRMLTWIFLPILLGVMGGIVGGIWTARYIRNRNRFLAEVISRNPFEFPKLREIPTAMGVWGVHAIIVVLMLISSDYTLLGSGPTLAIAFGVTWASMYRPWKSVYRRAVVLVRLRNREDQMTTHEPSTEAE